MINQVNRRDLSILIGNSLDHFDTSLYGFLAPILAPVFFPSHDFIIQLILTYGILATSIFTRPLGTLIFGSFASNYGPITGLSYSLIGVSITTVIMGCIPSYNSIGFTAPLLLTLFRMIRGIFSAGEITIAKLYIIENKPHVLALKASYLYQASTMVGIILASATSWLLIKSGFHELWRLCFWLGGFTGLVGYFLRKNENINNVVLISKDIFNSNNKSSLSLIYNNRVNVLRVAIITSFSYVSYSIPFIFMNNFVPLISEISLKDMMAINTTLLVFDMLLIPIIGTLLQKFSAKGIMLVASFILLISIIPIWCFIEGANIWYISFIRCWIVILGVIFMIPENIWYKNLFNSRDQYLLVGIGNALGTGIIGHMVPSICFSLWYLTGNVLSIGIFIGLISSLTFWAIYTSKD